MKTKFLILPVLVILGLSGCEQEGPAAENTLAKVNNYTITTKDFRQEADLLRPVFKNISSVSPDIIKAGILDEMIMRQVLLEEAQKMNIDKDEAFMRQIENFWRLSLIKELWAKKTDEISKGISVSDEEVQAEYAGFSDEIKQVNTLEEMTPRIREDLFTRKVQDALDAWEESLRAKAAVTKYDNVLNGLEINRSEGGAYERQ